MGVVCELILEDASSDNMGNNEFKDRVLPTKEGTGLTQVPNSGRGKSSFPFKPYEYHP